MNSNKTKRMARGEASSREHDQRACDVCLLQPPSKVIEQTLLFWHYKNINITPEVAFSIQHSAFNLD